VTDRRSIGLVGAGLVGLALARRLQANDYAVTGYDRDVARRDALAATGATCAADAAGVFAACDRVLLALYDDAQTAAVLAAGSPRPGSIVVAVHTGDPAEAERLAERYAAAQVAIVDAPLSGASTAIERGDALAMIGGHPEAIAACADLWPVLARERFVLGGPGSGQKAKLATNLVLGLNRAALAEGLAFAEALGVPGETFIDLLRASPAYSRAVDAKGPRMLARDYAPESRIAQHRKDLALMLAVAGRAGRGLPLTRVHAALLDAAIAFGEGDLDNAAIVETLRRAPPIH
jgi:3-hydroxyisobutyrate dehydrogenase-like beta-hydroxyacid dehydrogenase